MAAISDGRPLDPFEQVLQVALTDDFVSVSVVRERARLRMEKVAPHLARMMLSRDRPIATVIAALYELERHGFAEWFEIARCVRWRRAREAGKA